MDPVRTCNRGFLEELLRGTIHFQQKTAAKILTSTADPNAIKFNELRLGKRLRNLIPRNILRTYIRIVYIRV